MIHQIKKTIIYKELNIMPIVDIIRQLEVLFSHAGGLICSGRRGSRLESPHHRALRFVALPTVSAKTINLVTFNCNLK